MCSELTTSNLRANQFWARFCVSFSWDYPDDWSVLDVQEAVFNVVDDHDKRTQDQIVCNCVQSSGSGVCLTQPHPETDVIPCEMHFKAHPLSSEFCITKIVIVSEARNLELYIDDMYETTARGCMLTLKKGKKSALYENEFDLSAHVQSSNKITIKFLSMPDKQSLRLQNIIARVTKCSSNAPVEVIETATKMANSNTADMSSVRAILESMKTTLPPGAEKIMEDVERQQQMQTSQLGQLFAAMLCQPGAQSSLLAQPASTPTKRQQPSQPQQQPRPSSSDGESLLANAILRNAEMSRKGHVKELTDIQKQNQQQAQIDFLKQLLTNQMPRTGSQLSTQPPGSRTASQLSTQRPGSIVSLGRDSPDGDFATMLSNLMRDSHELGLKEDHQDFSRSSTPSNRWEAYLKSRIRASQRMSSESRPGSGMSSRPSSFCYSDTSERDFHRGFSESEDTMKGYGVPPPAQPNGKSSGYIRHYGADRLVAIM